MADTPKTPKRHRTLWDFIKGVPANDPDKALKIRDEIRRRKEKEEAKLTPKDKLLKKLKKQPPLSPAMEQIQKAFEHEILYGTKPISEAWVDADPSLSNVPPPTTTPYGDDYVQEWMNGPLTSPPYTDPPETTVPPYTDPPLQFEDSPGPPTAGWDNQAQIVMARRRRLRYCVLYRFDMGWWCIVDVTKKQGEIHTVPCPLGQGSWSGIERAIVERLCEGMNDDEQLRLVRLAKELQEKEKADAEERKRNLEKPMKIKRPWHRDRRDV